MKEKDTYVKVVLVPGVTYAYEVKKTMKLFCWHKWTESHFKITFLTVGGRAFDATSTSCVKCGRVKFYKATAFYFYGK